MAFTKLRFYFIYRAPMYTKNGIFLDKPNASEANSEYLFYINAGIRETYFYIFTTVFKFNKLL